MTDTWLISVSWIKNSQHRIQIFDVWGLSPQATKKQPKLLMMKLVESDSVHTNICCLSWQAREPKHVVCITVNQMEIRQLVVVWRRLVALLRYSFPSREGLVHMPPKFPQPITLTEMTYWAKYTISHANHNKSNCDDFNPTFFHLLSDYHSAGRGLHSPEDAAWLPAPTDRCCCRKQSHRPMTPRDTTRKIMAEGSISWG